MHCPHIKYSPWEFSLNKAGKDPNLKQIFIFHHKMKEMTQRRPSNGLFHFITGHATPGTANQGSIRVIYDKKSLIFVFVLERNEYCIVISAQMIILTRKIEIHLAK